MVKYEGADWLERQLRAYWSRKKIPGRGELSEFGRVVADLLGQAYRGFYHLPSSVWSRPGAFFWHNDEVIRVNVPDGHLESVSLGFEKLSDEYLLGSGDPDRRIRNKSRGDADAGTS